MAETSSPAGYDAAALRRILASQCEALRALEALLASETSALTGAANDPPARLVDLAAEKQRRLEVLATSGVALDQLLKQAGLSPDGKGLEQYVSSTHAGPELPALCAELKTRLENCRLLNHANGRVMERRRDAVQRAVSLLTGQSDTPGTYGATGRVGPGSGNRRLAKA